MAFRVGVDIGGTFTDLVALDEFTGKIINTKALTTSHDLTEAILTCVEQAGVDLKQTELVIHGTTVGVNALIEHKGAKTALFTTEGFRDVLEIGRGNSLRMYDLFYKRPPVLVPRRLRLEAPERLSATGEVLTPLDEGAIEAAIETLRTENVESVAIVFLFSYRNPVHEKRVAEIVRRALPGVSITVSHQISQEWREYERTNTVVINAYIQPIMERYLKTFVQAFVARGFTGNLLITESNGGAFSVEAALIKPVHTLESGPAAGAIGCAAVSQELANDRLISFDMGGTTAKCCIVEHGYPRVTDEYLVDGQPLRIPVVDIVEVSAGGGSIAWIDAGGALVLGPHSAGSRPGPACYGLGGDRPTVTDANLVVGRISPEAFLGGRMPLRLDLAQDVMTQSVANPLGMSAVDAAVGIVRLAEAKMGLAVKSITTERGLDPREYTLLAYGGCGPLHAVQIARELAIPTVAIPPLPSTFAAWGMLAADLRHDLVRTVLVPLETTDQDWAASIYDDMSAEILTIFPSSKDPQFRRGADLRYLGQDHTVTIDLESLASWPSLRESFDRAHERAYGYAAPDVEVELLNLRLSAVSPTVPPKMRKLESSSDDPAPSGRRKIFSSRESALVETPVFARDSLRAGQRIAGPAAIEEPSTTTYIDVGDELRVNDSGFLIIAVKQE
jgi:N-methylhydantoinase A